MLYPDENTNIKDALDHFYQSRDYGKEGGYYKNWVWFKIGFISIPLPNTRQRKENIFRHDLNHLITGYPTTWKGEFQIAAWEMGSGGWGKYWFINFITLQAMGLGLLFHYNAVKTAFQKGLKMNNALTVGLTKDQIFKLTIQEVKQLFERKEKRKRNFWYWKILGLMFSIGPFLIAITLFFLAFFINR